MTKLKIGVTYKVRKNLIPGNDYGGLYFAEEMEEYIGKKIKFIKVRKDGCGVTKDGWDFNQEMLITPKSKKVKKYKYSREELEDKVRWLFGEPSTDFYKGLKKQIMFDIIAKQSKQEDKKCEHKGIITDILNGDFFCPDCNEWIKKEPTTSLLNDVETIEEIKRAIVYPDFCEDLAKVVKEIAENQNTLISNQKKLYQYIKSLNQIK